MDEDDLPPEHASPIDLEPCQICGRRFNPDTLARHKNICQKAKKKEATRKPFDMAKQRAMGTDLEAFNSATAKYKKTPAEQAKLMAYKRQELKKKQWKRKHEDFIDTIRSAREYDTAAKLGAPLPPQEPSVPNPDYVQCPYCKRRFQEHAAERHIPFCKEKNERIERKPNGTGNSAVSKRLKYRPPLPRKRTGTEGATPPGANIVRKKTNFSSTYTVNENSDGPNDYQLAGEHKRRLTTGSEAPGGMTAQKLPGTTPKIHKPHPPSKILPPGFRSRVVHVKKTESFTQRTSPQRALHNGMASGYEDEEQDDPHSNNYPQKISARLQMRSRDGAGNGRLQMRSRDGAGNGHGSHSSVDGSDRSSNDGELARRGPVQRIENSLSDTSIVHRNGFDCVGPLSGHVMAKPRLLSRDRAMSDTGLRGSVHQQKKNSLLNQHGMSMSKFCYECGFKFPVPQAKYCCECGTKRI